MDNRPGKKKHCYFCVNGIDDIDYKDVTILRKFVNFHLKILPGKRTGVCSWHQRKLSQAIKRSRIMALIPFTRR
ncbi:30S ribosomal protein S18 [bacterium]|nr:30S ribosomal protein S18 [bacterium]